MAFRHRPVGRRGAFSAAFRALSHDVGTSRLRSPPRCAGSGTEPLPNLSTVPARWLSPLSFGQAGENRPPCGPTPPPPPPPGIGSGGRGAAGLLGGPVRPADFPLLRGPAARDGLPVRENGFASMITASGTAAMFALTAPSNMHDGCDTNKPLVLDLPRSVLRERGIGGATPWYRSRPGGTGRGPCQRVGTSKMTPPNSSEEIRSVQTMLAP